MDLSWFPCLCLSSPSLWVVSLTLVQSPAYNYASSFSSITTSTPRRSYGKFLLSFNLQPTILASDILENLPIPDLKFFFKLWSQYFRSNPKANLSVHFSQSRLQSQIKSYKTAQQSGFPLKFHRQLVHRFTTATTGQWNTKYVMTKNM